MDITSRCSRRELVRAGWLLGCGGALGGLLTPRLSTSETTVRAQDVPVDLTATRRAELEELSELRTQVAQSPECIAAPSETPVSPTWTPTSVPPLASGSPINYGGRFVINVLGLAPVPASGPLETQGQLLRLNVTVLNTSSEVVVPPFLEWRLIDGSGQQYGLSSDASSDVAGGWGLPLRPGVTEDRAIVFDVLPNAGTTFVLESTAEPTFRVALSIEVRG